MDILGTQVPKNMEHLVTPYYDKYYKAIRDLVMESEEFQLDRDPQIGDCFVKVSIMRPNVHIEIGICTRIEDGLASSPFGNVIAQHMTRGLRLNLDLHYVFKIIDIQYGNISINEDYFLSSHDMWFIPNEYWYKIEKICLMLKATTEALIKQNN